MTAQGEPFRSLCAADGGSGNFRMLSNLPKVTQQELGKQESELSNMATLPEGTSYFTDETQRRLHSGPHAGPGFWDRNLGLPLLGAHHLQMLVEALCRVWRRKHRQSPRPQQIG